MEKDCCNISVKKIDDGYRIEITGEDVNGCCQTAIRNKEHCCSEPATDEKKDVK